MPDKYSQDYNKDRTDGVTAVLAVGAAVGWFLWLITRPKTCTDGVGCPPCPPVVQLYE